MIGPRFTAIGDLHLIDDPVRNADRIAALDYVIDQAAGETDAWFLAGDLSHTGLTIPLRNLLIRRVLRMADYAPVVVVRGNHDPDGDLDFLAHLRGGHRIEVVTAPRVVELQTPNGSAAVFCLPYPNKAELVAAGTPHDQINTIATAALDVILLDAADRLTRSGAMATGTIGHITIRGSVSSSGQPQIGAEMELGVEQLARLPGFKVFNHIHKHQRVGADLWYCGSLCRMDYGETEPKGYLRIRCGVGAPVVEFVEIPVPPMFHIDARMTRDGLTWTARKGPGGDLDEAVVARRVPGSETATNWTGCDVRVQVRYAAAEADQIGSVQDAVAAIFGSARRLKIEPIAETVRVVRAPEVAAAVSLPDKLTAAARAMGVSWAPAVEVAAGRLVASEDGDAVVAAVSARLATLVAEAVQG